MKNKRVPIDTVIYWVRSTGPDGKDRVAMYFKGFCNRADEGERGFDIQARPVDLGPGPYVATYGGSDFEQEDGTVFP